MYGPYPPYYGFPMPYNTERGKPDKEVIKLAKQVLRDHKLERRKKRLEDKKKEAKSKPRMFTFLETVGIIMVGSIPFTMLQLWGLEYVRTALNAAMNAPH